MHLIIINDFILFCRDYYFDKLLNYIFFVFGFCTYDLQFNFVVNYYLHLFIT